MTQYAGNSANFPTDYTIVSDNTDRTASSVNVALTALGDRTAWLKAHAIDGLLGGTYNPSSPLNISNLGTLSGSGPLTLTGDITCDDITCDDLIADQITTNLVQLPNSGGTGIGHELSTTFARFDTDVMLKNASRVVLQTPRSTPIIVQAPFYANPTNWSHTLGSTFTNNVVNTRCWAALPNIPRTFTITAVRLYLRAGTGHVGLPTTKLSMSLVRVDKLTGISAVVFANTQDPSASVAAYEAYHNFALTGSHVYTPSTHKYYVEISAEVGTNALTGAEVYMSELVGTYNVIGE